MLCCCYPSTTRGPGPMAAMGSRTQSDRSGRGWRIYEKELSLIAEIGEDSDISVEKLIEEIEKTCGLNTLYACVPKGRCCFEITVGERETYNVLKNGLEIDGQSVWFSEVSRRSLVVSFMHLSSYVEDDEITAKLEDMGVEILSDIKRRYHRGTNVADGTRYVRVTLPHEVKSLPYAMKFRTGNTSEYFKVVHDNQTKVCSLCLSAAHTHKACPEFRCHRCNLQGHVVRNCETPKCDGCGYYGENCICDYCDDCGQFPCECLPCNLCQEQECVCPVDEPDSNMHESRAPATLSADQEESVNHELPTKTTLPENLARADSELFSAPTCEDPAEKETARPSQDMPEPTPPPPEEGVLGSRVPAISNTLRNIQETSLDNEEGEWTMVGPKHSSQKNKEGEDKVITRRARIKPVPNLSKARRVTPY